MVKIYQKTQLNAAVSSMRLTVNGKSKTVIFESKRRNGLLTCEIADKNVQEAIESTVQFENGQIECISGGTSKKGPVKAKEEEVEKPKAEPEVFDDVTTFQQAKDMLKGEPYEVPFQALNTPANILKKAAELGISFPNLKAE